MTDIGPRVPGAPTVNQSLGTGCASPVQPIKNGPGPEVQTETRDHE